MNTLFGLKIIITQDHPRMQLSERIKEVLTPAQIADHNAWMREFFGTTNLCKDGAYIISQIDEGFVLMNPRTYERMKRVVNGRLHA